MARSDTMGTAGFREETHLLESTSESAQFFWSGVVDVDGVS